uniref:Uncharacterized protein n=1 Tax=Ditylenchus dipsaci TaxID=166011 RepID=A0A915DW89_9BILA
MGRLLSNLRKQPGGTSPRSRLSNEARISARHGQVESRLSEAEARRSRSSQVDCRLKGVVFSSSSASSSIEGNIKGSSGSPVYKHPLSSAFSRPSVPVVEVRSSACGHVSSASMVVALPSRISLVSARSNLPSRVSSLVVVSSRPEAAAVPSASKDQLASGALAPRRGGRTSSGYGFSQVASPVPELRSGYRCQQVAKKWTAPA